MASGDAEEMSSRRARQIPCLASESVEVCKPSSRVGRRLDNTPSPALRMSSPKALLAMTLCSMLELPRRLMSSCVRVGTSSLRVLGLGTSTFQTAIAAERTAPAVSQRQT